MARVFLDTNYFIDAIHRRPEKQILDSLENHLLCISVLSVHIYCYTFKIKIPSLELTAQKEKFQLVELTENIVDQSLIGPTADFEDNVQLHSSVSVDCDLFLTSDKKLLNMKFFGKAKIADEIDGDLLH